MNHDILLTNGAISLRPYTMADVQDLYEAASESIPEMTPWMPWCHSDYDIEESRSWVVSRPQAWKDGTDYCFAIVDAGDGSFLGACGLNGFSSANKHANLGYWVRTSRTRQGIATAATLLLAGWGFRKMQLDRIEIVVAVDNQPSQRVATKVGATREGVLRNRLTLAEDKISDAVMFSLIPQDLGL